MLMKRSEGLHLNICWIRNNQETLKGEKGKLLAYCDFDILEYLTPMDHVISIDDKMVISMQNRSS